MIKTGGATQRTAGRAKDGNVGEAGVDTCKPFCAADVFVEDLMDCECEPTELDELTYTAIGTRVHLSCLCS